VPNSSTQVQLLTAEEWVPPPRMTRSDLRPDFFLREEWVPPATRLVNEKMLIRKHRDSAHTLERAIERIWQSEMPSLCCSGPCHASVIPEGRRAPARRPVSTNPEPREKKPAFRTCSPYLCRFGTSRGAAIHTYPQPAFVRFLPPYVLRGAGPMAAALDRWVHSLVPHAQHAVATMLGRAVRTLAPSTVPAHLTCM
jgi:hypothetical protein